MSGTTLGEASDAPAPRGVCEGVTARGSKQGMQFFSQAQNSHPLGAVAKEVRKQELPWLPGGHRERTHIQPDDLAGFGVSLDIETVDSIPRAKPVSDGAREGTEWVTRERLASHHLVARTVEDLTGLKTQQPLRSSVPQHDIAMFVGQHGVIGSALQHVRDLLHATIQPLRSCSEQYALSLTPESD